MRRNATYKSRHRNQLEHLHIILQSFLFSKAKMKLLQLQLQVELKADNSLKVELSARGISVL